MLFLLLMLFLGILHNLGDVFSVEVSLNHCVEGVSDAFTFLGGASDMMLLLKRCICL